MGMTIFWRTQNAREEDCEQCMNNNLRWWYPSATQTIRLRPKLSSQNKTQPNTSKCSQWTGVSAFEQGLLQPWVGMDWKCMGWPFWGLRVVDIFFMPAQDNEVEQLPASPRCRPEPGWGERHMPSTPMGYPSLSKDQGISLTCRILKNAQMTNKDPTQQNKRNIKGEKEQKIHLIGFSTNICIYTHCIKGPKQNHLY